MICCRNGEAPTRETGLEVVAHISGCACSAADDGGNTECSDHSLHPAEAKEEKQGSGKEQGGNGHTGNRTVGIAHQAYDVTGNRREEKCHEDHDDGGGKANEGVAGQQVIHNPVQGLGDRIFYFGGDISPALLAVGFIVRLNIAVLIFIGGTLAWILGIPLLGSQTSVDGPLESAWLIWSTQIRYLGVGAMVVGGIASIVKVRSGLLEAIHEISRLRKGSADTSDSALTDRDISSKSILVLSAVTVLLIGIVYYLLTGNALISLATTVIMVLMAFFFTAVASYIVGLVGNSNSPVSGMTITALLFTGALLLLFGFSGMEGMVATLGVAAIVCCAACTSGDVCNDLKTGSLVGASPFRQQIMQILGVAAASLVMAPVLQLLHNNTPGGIGGRELSAPQASLFKSLVEGLFGQGDLPWNMVGIGVGGGLCDPHHR